MSLPDERTPEGGSETCSAPSGLGVRGVASPGFLCALFGILVTTLAWFGPWTWPAWPAMAVLFAVFTPERSFAALSFPVRSAIVVALMFWNVASWAIAARGVAILRRRLAA